MKHDTQGRLLPISRSTLLLETIAENEPSETDEVTIPVIHTLLAALQWHQENHIPTTSEAVFDFQSSYNELCERVESQYIPGVLLTLITLNPHLSDYYKQILMTGYKSAIATHEASRREVMRKHIWAELDNIQKENIMLLISMVAHDMRSPLSLTLGYAQMVYGLIEGLDPQLLEKGTADEIMTYLKTAMTGVNKANKTMDLIREILSEPCIEDFAPKEELPKYVREMISVHRFNHEIQIVVTTEIQSASIDRALLQYALLQLLSNAAKYIDPDDAQIHIRFNRIDKDFVLEVVNTSIDSMPEIDDAGIEDIVGIMREADLSGDSLKVGTKLIRIACKRHGVSIRFSNDGQIGDLDGLAMVQLCFPDNNHKDSNLQQLEAATQT